MSQTKAQLINGKSATVEFTAGSASTPAVTFTGDPNTGIYSPGADQLAISTGGVQRIFLGSGGNVGVGESTSLGARLDVSTTSTSPCVIRARNDSTSVYLDANNGYAYLNVYSNHPLLIGTNNTERARITADGKVGIGTSSPSVGLQVTSSTTYASYANVAARIGSNVTSDLLLGSLNGNSPFVASEGAYPLLFQTNGSEQVRIDSSGRVGIGTTSPGGKLQISESFATSGTKDLLRLQSESGVDGCVMRIGGYAYAGNARSAIDLVQNAGSNFQSQIVFSTSAGADALERVRIDSSGRLLVGTSAQINGVFGNSAAVQFTTTTGTQALALSRFTADAFSADIDFLKSRNTTVGQHTIVQNNDQLGNLNFGGSDGTQFLAAASIAAGVDGTPGLNDMPGRLVFSTAADGASIPTERMRITSDGRVGIGTSTPGGKLVVSDGSTTFQFDPVGGTGNILRSLTSAGARDSLLLDASQLVYSNGGTERLRCDSSGRLLVGTSSSLETNSRLQIQNGHIRLHENNDTAGAGYEINWSANGGTTGRLTAAIRGVQQTTGTSGGRLEFSTTADGASSPTERMRINNAGNLNIGRTSDLAVTPRISVESPNFGIAINTTNGGSNEAMRFYNAGTAVGTITTTGSATAYNTSSDYRLKANIEPVTDGITRLQQLKPSRFNFIAEPGKTVDGFLAHEAAEVVPECVTGEKDAVDDDGNPVYQGIDQSKLVPLLTAALQEAVAKIESLEGRLTAAGI